MDSHALRYADSIYAGGVHQQPHEHGDLHLSLVLRGVVAEQVGSTTELGNALSVVVKDPGVLHANDFGVDGAVMARLEIPKRGLADLIDDASRARPWHWAHDVRVARPFLRLVARAHAGACQFAAEDDDVVDLLSALTARAAPARGGAPPVWLRDAIAHLREGWTPTLSVRDVAAAARVHPVYLARCVRRWYGSTPANELRRARMQRTAGALASGDATVSSTAHALGFADESHLCREFQRAVSLTPGSYRALAREVAARAHARRVARVKERGAEGRLIK